MLFNSLEFGLFLSLVFVFYWFVLNRDLKLQNLFIVAVSYLFYGWWDWRFLILIAFTTLCSYASGLLIGKFSRRHYLPRIFLICNCTVNFLILGVFKYFGFFAENLGRIFELLGFTMDWVTFDILLPVGISFYTFQALSYSIDVYKRKMEPSRDIVVFFAYISFFPQLVAGPIERAINLLPQFLHKRSFQYSEAVVGMRMILWGFFKKIVVADSCAVFVNKIFENYDTASASLLWLGIFLFAFQLYGDFSGYSDIAIGTARLLGFKLMRNFNSPYFSRNIAELWSKWHISLTTWFRDYVYIPLGGSHGSKWLTVRNTVIVFLLSGLWHGANWTFITWGAYNALLFIPLVILGKNRKYMNIVAKGRLLPNMKEFVQISAVFLLFVVGMVFFRSDNITIAEIYLYRMFDRSVLSMPDVFDRTLLVECVSSIFILQITEWVNRAEDYNLAKLPANQIVRWLFYLFLGVIIILSYKQDQLFIYFQF